MGGDRETAFLSVAWIWWLLHMFLACQEEFHIAAQPHMAAEFVESEHGRRLIWKG
jgi:hypothetical protein